MRTASDTRYGIQGEVRAIHRKKTVGTCERSVLSRRAEPVSEAVARNAMDGASDADLDNRRRPVSEMAYGNRSRGASAMKHGTQHGACERPSLDNGTAVRAKIARHRCMAASVSTVPIRTCFASDLR